MITEQNCTMLCDFYQLTMGNGYYNTRHADRIAYFDVFFRKVPDGGGYAVCAGLEQVINYIQGLHFTDDDIQYLRGKKIFSEGFLEYLRDFKFTGDIWAVPEGTPVFPSEPLLTVRAPAIQAQLIETMLLLLINHQSLIATKANRIVRAAQGRAISEFGSRRAQGASGAVLGAVLRTSAAAQALPALSRTSSTEFPPPVRWRIAGSRCSTASLKRSKAIAEHTPIPPLCWWTPTTF